MCCSGSIYIAPIFLPSACTFIVRCDSRESIPGEEGFLMGDTLLQKNGARQGFGVSVLKYAKLTE